MRLKDLKVTDFSTDKNYSFVFPIGATEQHGPFLPFGTDTYVTDYLVSKLVQQFPHLVLLPTLEISRSKEHAGFYGTIWLAEGTLTNIIKDVCNALSPRAIKIYLTSFHANDSVINNFILDYQQNYPNTQIINLEMCNGDDLREIEKLIGGELDEHAGNTELSNMLVIRPETVIVPPDSFPKRVIQNPWETDNLADKSDNGIVDNHHKWIVDKEIGQKILEIYENRMVTNLRAFEVGVIESGNAPLK